MLFALVLPSSGVARLNAWIVGEVEGKKWLLSLLISLPSVGSVIVETTTTTIQPSSTNQRKRSTARPKAAKKRSMGRILPARRRQCEDGAPCVEWRRAISGSSQLRPKATAATGTATRKTTSSECA